MQPLLKKPKMTNHIHLTRVLLTDAAVADESDLFLMHAADSLDDDRYADVFKSQSDAAAKFARMLSSAQDSLNRPLACAD